MLGIVIGAGAESIYAIKKARELGHTILAFDGDEKALGLKFANQAIIADIRDPEIIINKLGSITPDFILPIPIGRYLTTAGYINDYYNLVGISEKSSVLCTDKLLFHNQMKEARLRPISCISLKQGELLKGINDLCFPLIVKPRFGSGSRAVQIMDCAEKLDRFFGDAPYEEDFIIESALDGDEYGVDAAVIDNQFYLILLRKKVITPPPIRQCIAYASITNHKENEELIYKVSDYMTKAIVALEMNNCLLHADIMVTKSLTVTAIEISGRPSGHRLHDVFTPLACGIDMIKEYICYCNQETYHFMVNKTKSLAIRYFDFQNCKVIKQPNLQYLKENYELYDYQCNIGAETLGSVVDGHSIMDRGYFIVAGEDAIDALQKCQEIIDLFEIEYS